MNESKLAQKVKVLEGEISEIRRYLGFGIAQKDLDQENWQKVKEVSRKIRKDLFKERYPELYAKTQGKK